jgi:3-deoxy-7-phosphoheptulonate synthase
MTILVHSSANRQQIRRIVDALKKSGWDPFVVSDPTTRIVGLNRTKGTLPAPPLEGLPGVGQIFQTQCQFPLASRECNRENTVVDVDGVKVGGREFVVIAGPCAVESREVLYETARAVWKAGAKILRGGAFKPRSSPYAFQGLGKKGLELLARARELTGLKICTEVVDTGDLSLVSDYADIIQVGSRNMCNFKLLKMLGKSRRPVLLKRGMSAKVREFLMAAEYVLAEGNPNVILCERGVVGFDSVTRNILDLACVPVVKALSHLPIVVDPSHATGYREYIAPLSRGALAVGADGLLVEVHPRPDQALCDGRQSVTTDQFRSMMRDLSSLSKPLGRVLEA